MGRRRASVAREVRLTALENGPHNAGALRREPAPRLDAKAQSLLRELSRALLEAISESSAVADSLRRLHRQGFTLHLVLDCRRDESVRGSATGPGNGTAGAEAAFRIDADDLAFLRSIGIDPTRRRRRRSTTP